MCYYCYSVDNCFNFRCDKDSGLQTLFCTICRREVGLWNFSAMKMSHEAGRGAEEYRLSPSHDTETMSVLKSSAGEAVETQRLSHINPLFESASQQSDIDSRTEETAMTIEVCEKLEMCLDASECSTDHTFQTQKSYSRGGTDTTAILGQEEKVTATCIGEGTVSFARLKDVCSGAQKESVSPMVSEPSGSSLEQRVLGSLMHRSLTDLTDKDNAESLCVEVEEESLTEKLQAVESELEYIGCSRRKEDDYEPQRKRMRPLQVSALFCELAECLAVHPHPALYGAYLYLRFIQLRMII